MTTGGRTRGRCSSPLSRFRPKKRPRASRSAAASANGSAQKTATVETLRLNSSASVSAGVSVKFMLSVLRKSVSAEYRHGLRARQIGKKCTHIGRGLPFQDREWIDDGRMRIGRKLPDDLHLRARACIRRVNDAEWAFSPLHKRKRSA